MSVTVRRMVGSSGDAETVARLGERGAGERSRVRCSAWLAGFPTVGKLLPQQQTLMTTGVVVYGSHNLKAALCVKGWRLEAERGEDDLPTASPASFVLCCTQQPRPQPLSTARLLDPELPDLTATAPRIPADPRDHSASLVFHEDRQPLAVRDARRL
jgi:hypothetical protein